MIEDKRFSYDRYRKVKTIADINDIVGFNIRAVTSELLAKEGFISPGLMVRFNEALEAHYDSEALYFLERPFKGTSLVYGSYIPPYARTSEHFHPTEEKYRVIDGEIMVSWVVDGKREQKPIKKGDEPLIIPSGVLHQAYTADSHAVLFLVTKKNAIHPHGHLHMRPHFPLGDESS